jgi:hypothetical protein
LKPTIKFKTEDNVPAGKLKKRKKIIFFASLKSLKIGVGSGSISQRYGAKEQDILTFCRRLVRKGPREGG